MRKINTKIILGDCREVLKDLDENSIYKKGDWTSIND